MSRAATLARRTGWMAFLFFLCKGLVWLAVAGTAWGLGSL